MLNQLRTATRQTHQALEGVLGLLDEHLDLSAYTEVLRRLYGFWIGWEPQVAALIKDYSLVHPRRRLHLLAADLTALGFSREALDALPHCPLVDISSRAEAIGSLYVMEGSTLGGKLIGRNLERCLDPAGQAACTYFTGYGLQTGPMWKAFLIELASVPGDHAEAAARGATATFDRLGWWLTR